VTAPTTGTFTIHFSLPEQVGWYTLNHVLIRSVATTIGYGSITPTTEEGKLFCIIFTIIGIPYFAYMIGAIADLIGQGIDWYKSKNKISRFVI